MKNIWNYNLKNIPADISRLLPGSGIILLLFVICYGCVAIILSGLYGIVKNPCYELDLLSITSGICYITVIWYISIITNLFIFSYLPGLTYLDKETPTTRRLYAFAGPFLYPKIFCLILFLIFEMETVDILVLLRRSPNNWAEVSHYYANRPQRFISSVEKYRRYLRE